MVADALAGLRAVLLGPDRAPARQRGDALLWPVLAVAVAGYVLAGLEGAAPLVRAALAVAAAGPVALMHSSPLIAWRVAVLATFVTVPAEVAPGGLAWPWHPVQLLVVPAAVFAVALRHRPAVVAWAAVLSGPAMLARVPAADTWTVIVVLAVVAGTGVQVRRRAVAHLTRRALAEQRTSIARELHDVVGHHMSLIAVRAESAPYRLVSRPEEQRAEFAAIADASRDALHDMRCLVGTLRAGDGPPGIGALAARAAAAGVAVTVDVDPAVGHVPVAVYRVVQEALSNATRHAPGGTVRIELHRAGDSVHVGVHNTAATRPAQASGSVGGNGLTGMRERVTALGGTLRAGPAGDGGFRVDAVVPGRLRSSVITAQRRRPSWAAMTGLMSWSGGSRGWRAGSATRRRRSRAAPAR